MSDLMNKIAKLLNQAERAATEEEADAFLSMAQTLSTKYSIDLAVARAHTAKLEQVQQPEKRMSTFEGVKRNNKKHYVNLFHEIARSNDTKIDIAYDSSYVVAYGFPTDIDVVEAMFAHLSVQMVESANQFIASGAYKNELTPRWTRTKNYHPDGWEYDHKTGRFFDWEEKYESKPVDGRVARASFYEGFIREIGNRLRSAKQAVVEEEEQKSSGTALALIDKKQSVDDFYREASNARGQWKGTTSNSMSTSGFSSGIKSGQSARLSGQRSVGGARAALHA